MRVTSWNCFRGADVLHGLSLLSPLRSDLITLQECRRPAIDSASVIWRGTDLRQGVAVVSTEAAAWLEFVEIPKLHPTVVPVRVQAPQPFVFVGAEHIRPTTRWLLLRRGRSRCLEDALVDWDRVADNLVEEVLAESDRAVP